MDFKLEAKKYEKQFKEDLKEIVSIASLRDDSTKSEKAPFGKACRAALDKMMEIAIQKKKRPKRKQRIPLKKVKKQRSRFPKKR